MIDKHELAQLLTDATEATLDWREALAGVADALREEGDKPMPELPAWVEPPISGGQHWRVRQTDGYWWRIPRNEIARIGELHSILKERGE